MKLMTQFYILFIIAFVSAILWSLFIIPTNVTIFILVTCNIYGISILLIQRKRQKGESND